MSLFNSATLTCGSCGAEVEVSWAASVNADRRPDLKQAIIDGSFQSHDCGECGAKIRLPPHLSFLDVGSGRFILVEDPQERGSWSKHAAKATRLFEQTVGGGAPGPAQDIGKNLVVRLVFGWPALREKLTLAQLGLDDTTMELVKLAVLKGSFTAQLSGDETMRVVEADDETIVVDVIDDKTEAVSTTASIPRSVYDDVAGDVQAWAALRAELDSDVFVDASRLYLQG